MAGGDGARFEMHWNAAATADPPELVLTPASWIYPVLAPAERGEGYSRRVKAGIRLQINVATAHDEDWRDATVAAVLPASLDMRSELSRLLAPGRNWDPVLLASNWKKPPQQQPNNPTTQRMFETVLIPLRSILAEPRSILMLWCIQRPLLLTWSCSNTTATLV